MDLSRATWRIITPVPDKAPAALRFVSAGIANVARPCRTLAVYSDRFVFWIIGAVLCHGR